MYRDDTLTDNRQTDRQMTDIVHRETIQQAGQQTPVDQTLVLLLLVHEYIVEASTYNTRDKEMPIIV